MTDPREAPGGAVGDPGGGPGRSGIDIPLVATAGILSLTAMMEMGVVNIAIPEIGASTGASVATATWVVLAYQIPLMLLLIPVGIALDSARLRPLLTRALVVFGTTGVFAALTPPGDAGIPWLITLRVVQGAAAAVMFVLMPVLAARSAPPERRATAMSVTATLGPVGAVLGPALGGPVVDVLGWRAVFLIKLPLVAVALLLARTSLSPEARVSMPGGGARGGILRSAGAKLRDALRGRVLVALVLATLGLAAAMQAMQFTLSVTLQGEGRSATGTGGVLLVFTLVMAMTGILAGRLADAVGTAATTITGGLLVILGLLTLVPLDGSWGTPTLVAGLVVVGVGMGLYAGPTQAWVMSTAEHGRAASTASVMQLARTGGFALGPLAAGGILGSPLGVSPGAAVSLGVATAAAALATVCFVAAASASSRH